MAVTHSCKTTLNGQPIEIDYIVSGCSSSPSYSPLHGACGGDDAEFSIECIYQNGEEITVSDDTLEKLLQVIMETHIEEPDDDYYLDG